MILIDIPLPDNCLECPLHDGEYGYCNADRNIDINIYERPRSCPIVSEVPKQKLRKWETHTYMPHNKYCPNCKKDSPYNKRWDFCPNCGMDMRGE